MGTRRPSWAAVAAVALTAGIALGGCGSSDSPSEEPAPSTAGSGAATSSIVATTTDGTAAASEDAMVVTSAAFGDGEPIPLRHACTNQGGEGASPPLAWSGVPDGATSLVLVVHDPDAPLPGGFTHLVTELPLDTSEVADGANQSGSGPMTAWIGPCPPSGEHRYTFTLYAFGPDVELPADADKTAVDAVASEAIATSVVTGLFAKQ